MLFIEHNYFIYRILDELILVLEIFNEKEEKVENDPYASMEEEEMLVKLKCSRKHCEEGRYYVADAVVSDLRRKYGFEGTVTEEAEADMDRFVGETV